MPTDSTKVFILAQNRLLREALTRLLSKKNDIEVVGASDFCPQLVQLVASGAPDVLLSDSAAFATPQLDLVLELRNAVPGLKVVLIAMDPAEDAFLQAVREGIAGYLLKDASALEVATAVRAAARGEAICPPQLCTILFKYIAAEKARSLRLPLRRNLGLTRREQQLMERIDQGFSNKEIASDLNLSEQTVKNHVHRILRKLGAPNRASAVELCRLPGVVT